MNEFATETDFNHFTSIDGNKDGIEWTYVNHGNNGWARMSFNADKQMDDWLISAPVRLEVGKSYYVSIEAASNGASYPERFELKLGKEPTAESMTKTIMSATEVTDTQIKEFGEYVYVTSPGIYYIGLHGISNPGMYHLDVFKFSVSEPIMGMAPGTVENLVAIPGENGALTATLKFTAPQVTFNGNVLESIEKIEISRNSEVVKTIANPTPGDEIQVVDEVNVSGTYNYSVRAYNSSGVGNPVETSLYIGVDYPAAPSAIAVNESKTNPGEVTISWSAVNADINGNNLNNVTYNVYDCSGSVAQPLATGISATEYTYRAISAGQKFFQYAVEAVSERGTLEESVIYSTLIPVGKAYDGYMESFADCKLSYVLGVTTSIGGGKWTMYNDTKFKDVKSYDNDNGFFDLEGQYAGCAQGFYTGKISLEQIESSILSFYMYRFSDTDANTLTISAREVGELNYTELGKTVANTLPANGWNRVLIDLSEYDGKEIQLMFDGVIKSYTNLPIDNIKVGSIVNHDLAINAISAPQRVNAGAQYEVSVDVANYGTLTASGWKINLYADDALLNSISGPEIAPGQSTSVSLTCTMSPIAVEAVNHHAELEYAADEADANNVSETITVYPIENLLPAVTDLKGKAISQSSNELTWSEPDMSAGVCEPVYNNFEDGESYADFYKDWIFLDMDESPIGGFNDVEYPISVGTTQSFWIHDSSYIDGIYNEGFAAHSGTKCLASLYRLDNGTVDDWVISPELPGIAQTISFWARSYTKDYPEIIEIRYSTGSVETDDFIEIKSIISVPASWTQYYVELPQGAKRFAIRSVAKSSFMLMLDDFSYTATTDELTLKGYNIYRDGTRINEKTITETTYVDNNLSTKEHEYIVTAVYEEGESRGSNVVMIDNAASLNDIYGGIMVNGGKGSITVEGATGVYLTIASIDGMVIYAGTPDDDLTLNVTQGVYLVKAGNTVKSVLVR
ncbi:MAG: choice-of-anchor J domain-containing protein [Prevotella sp.]|nr:choice-of-anchor J domain-containing protein [Prevotella sp.]MCM1074072.1 choice-of-anchor J domain-containing protein [Ruminococcus sp.]